MRCNLSLLKFTVASNETMQTVTANTISCLTCPCSVTFQSGHNFNIVEFYARYQQNLTYAEAVCTRFSFLLHESLGKRLRNS